MLRRLYLISFVMAIRAADQDIYWRDFKDNVPTDAILVGNGTYIGQVIYQGFLTPGSIFPDKGTFVSEYFGKFEVKDHIRILCSRNPSRFRWERINLHSNTLPIQLEDRAVEGGYQGDIRWYIGRWLQENEWRVGKVELYANDYKGLLIWNNDGSLARLFEFDILTYV